jgi:hypothetical protein
MWLVRPITSDDSGTGNGYDTWETEKGKLARHKEYSSTAVNEVQNISLLFPQPHQTNTLFDRCNMLSGTSKVKGDGGGPLHIIEYFCSPLPIFKTFQASCYLIYRSESKSL